MDARLEARRAAVEVGAPDAPDGDGLLLSSFARSASAMISATPPSLIRQ